MTSIFALLLNHQAKCYEQLIVIIEGFKALVFDAKNHESARDDNSWTKYLMQPNISFEQEQMTLFSKTLPLVEQTRSKAKRNCLPVTWGMLKRPCDPEFHKLMTGATENNTKRNLLHTLWQTSLMWEVINGIEVKETFPTQLCSL